MNRLNKNNITSVLFGLALAIVLFGSGYKLAQMQYKTSSSSAAFNTLLGQELRKQGLSGFDESLLEETREKLEEKYVDRDKLDEKKQFYGAIKGLVASLGDPYTFFLTPEENKQSKDDLGGRFEGIGAQLGMKNNQIAVIAPLKNSPAEQAGVKAGDYVLKVNGESTKDWTLPQAVSKIRGPKGTKVTLTLFRDPGEVTVNIVRDSIQVDSVEVSIEQAPAGGTTNQSQTTSATPSATRLATDPTCKTNCKQVGVIAINQFNETTNAEWDRAVDSFLESWNNKTVEGLVLDLRDNPGGFLDSSVYIASDFVKRNDLIVKQSSKVNGDREYRSRRDGRLRSVPTVVLINQGSASASEILAGALRDHKKAIIMGVKSFGKGSVQEALDLRGGAGLHVTIAKWLLPAGDWINGKGIEPQLKVENKADTANTTTKESDEQLKKAIEYLVK